MTSVRSKEVTSQKMLLSLRMPTSRSPNHNPTRRRASRVMWFTGQTKRNIKHKIWDRLTATAEPSNGYEEGLIIPRYTDSRCSTVLRGKLLYALLWQSEPYDSFFCDFSFPLRFQPVVFCLRQRERGLKRQRGRKSREDRDDKSEEEGEKRSPARV